MKYLFLSAGSLSELDNALSEAKTVPVSPCVVPGLDVLHVLLWLEAPLGLEWRVDQPGLAQHHQAGHAGDGGALLAGLQGGNQPRHWPAHLPGCEVTHLLRHVVEDVSRLLVTLLTSMLPPPLSPWSGR